MRNESRVGWGPILAGMITAAGGLLCFAFLGRSIGVNGPVAYPGPVVAFSNPVLYPGFSGSLFILLAHVVSFGVAGYAIAAFGAFRSASTSALHAFASFSATVVSIYYSGRGTIFVGRPGFPFGIANPAVNAVLTPQMSWAIFVGVFAGGIACCASAYWAWGYLRGASLPVRSEETARDRAA